MTTWSQKEFDRLSAQLFNMRIGDFLYIHREANPRWHYFDDIKGNTIQYGGQGNSTDVIVRINGDSVEMLRPRLIGYMENLLGRHHEKLHEEGRQLFHGVTIILPYNPFSSKSFEVTIHTGSGCCYDQDEIAYEVMAALSGVSVYKAISPFGSYCDFVRKDIVNDSQWITYWHSSQGIKVEFNHVDDRTAVCISKAIHSPREDWHRFKTLMYDYFDKFIVARTGQTFVREYGYRVYEAKDPRDHESLSVQIDSGSEMSFAMSVPYGLSFVSFPRLRFAKDIMEYLSEAFKQEPVML